MADGKLTDRREKYVHGLVFDGLSQRQAYKAAFNTSKMKDTTIDVKACNLLKDDKVRARFDELQDKLRKEAEDEGIMSAKEVLKELSKVASADIGDYLAYKTVQTKIGVDEDGGDVIDYAPVVDLKDSEEVDTSVIAEVSIGANGIFKFKMNDKMKALDMLGKHHGIFSEKLNINHKLEDDGLFDAIKQAGDRDS